MASGLLKAALCGLALAVAGVSVPTAAMAKSKLLTKARKAYDDLDYTKAQSLLTKALKGNPTFEEQVEIYVLLATVHAIYGRDDQARTAFLEALKRNPDLELPADTSPKIRAAFADAKEAWKTSGSPRVTSGSGEESPVHPTGDAGEGDEETKADSATPAAGTGASSDGKAAPAAVVQPDNPLMAGVSSYEQHEPFYKKWWFWTVVGVVVVGAGAGAMYYLTKPTVPKHDFGPIPLQ